MSEGTRSDLSNRPLARSSFSFGLPLALAMMGHGLFNLIDLIIVGQLGAGAIAAVTIPGIMLTVLMLMFDGVSNTTVALTSQFHGARKQESVHTVAWESFVFALLASVVGGALLFFTARPLMESFGIEDEAAVENGVEYLRILAAGLGTMFLIMQTTAVLRGVGNSFWPMVILVGANGLNVILDLVLVFGWWGFPEMGVAGAAWATVISRGLGSLLGMFLLWNGVEGVRLRAHRLSMRFRYLKTLTFVGLPTALQLAVRVLTWYALLRVAAAAETISRTALVDGVGVCIRLEMIAVLLGLGWGGAATTIVGQNLGARRVRRSYRAALVLTLFAMISMTLLGAFIWVLREPLLAGIAPEIDAFGTERAFQYLAITIAFYPVMALSFVISRALNGAGSTKTPMVIDLLLFIVILVPAAAFWSGAGLGSWGEREVQDPNRVWQALVVAHVVSAIAYLLVWQNGHWRRKKLAARDAESR